MAQATSTRPIYLDHHATTPVDPRVLGQMYPYFSQYFGNPGSDHAYGIEAGCAIERARQQVAAALQAREDEIIFTSGGTEANNLAIAGVAERYGEQRRHMITCQTEHMAVLNVCRELERQGWGVTYLSVDEQGCLDLEDLRRAITAETTLISIMAANNEIGVLAPLAEIGEIAHAHNVLFHTDATQAAGLLSLDVRAMQIDLLTLSAHKVYGPKGVGALYVRKTPPPGLLVPQVRGGGHERGLRSGTLNVPGIVGLGEALGIAVNEQKCDTTRLRDLRDRLWDGLSASITGIVRNGHPTKCLPNNLNVAIPGVDAQNMLALLRPTVALSTGSACHTFTREPSHVILALGKSPEHARCTLRMGLGRFTTVQEIADAVHQISSAVSQLRG